MPVPYLLISTPPHGDVDAKIAAEAFELSAAEARIRANFPSPNIWFADDDLDALKKTGATLMKAGVKVRIIKGSIMAAIPRADPITSFAFGPDRFTAQLHSSDEFTAPYNTRLVIVASKGNPEDAMATSSGIPNILDDALFFDLYFVVQSKVRRLRAWSGGVDYAGLETALKPVAHQNHSEFLNQLRHRFPQAAVDERLVDTPPPKPSAISGKGLPAVLESIHSDLKDIVMGDLRSRLVFLSLL